MNSDDFKQMIQTYGANPSKWETSQDTSLCEKEFAKELELEKRLDVCLDLYVPPVQLDPVSKIYAAVMKKQRDFVFFFIKRTAWMSLGCMLLGICLGWYQTQTDYANTENYFKDMITYTIDY